ncbi:hypothetical protein [Methanoregula formicica]|uniref:Uncharacterized protein n=1 Tax=Methanoregula formicica (strain DSM 22288 / NBRC 105244 / SMSP) TaxID=593750 RepID=L0HJ74_METFS|nr:hypothetical protein [Methanoregula formicica]AGB03358.1 hypothetical protein Metfor_2354 [Methanoregula formicica SMSP]
MKRNEMILLFVLGCIVSIIGFFLAQYLLTLIIIALILCAFLYSDFKEWRESNKSDLKKIENRVEALERKQ